MTRFSCGLFLIAISSLSAFAQDRDTKVRNDKAKVSAMNVGSTINQNKACK